MRGVSEDRQALLRLFAIAAIATRADGGRARNRALCVATVKAGQYLASDNAANGDRIARALCAFEASLDLIRAAGVPPQDVAAAVSRHRMNKNTPIPGATPPAEALLHWLVQDGLTLGDMNHDER